MSAPALCRDCAAALPSAKLRCPKCGGSRIFIHPELRDLFIGHIDCDSFYATVEKRDRPDLIDKPVIVGGEGRAVVAACCYVARMSGVRSAMPIHMALDRCPDAVVLPVNMSKYKAVGHRAREIMASFADTIEPLSIDEAFLDLRGVWGRLHISPAQALAEIVRRFEAELGITASVGLSYNKMLAKVASDLDKPKGFAVIGRREAVSFLAPKPVKILWGVGPALEHRLYVDGIRKVGDLQSLDEIDLVRRYGQMGRRLFRFARGEDDRRVEPEAPSKSISAEETLDFDTGNFEALRRELIPLAEKVAQRMRRENLAGRSVILKLKTSDFQILSRSKRVDPPTQSASRILEIAERLLEAETDGRTYRLIGVGCADLIAPSAEPDLFA